MRSVESPGSNDDGQVLARELRDTDATVMHDLRCPAAGVIDHVIVGPGGVTVIASGRGRDADVRKVRRQRLAVRLALAGAPPELRNVGVVGCLCQPNAQERPVSPLRDDVVAAGAVAAARLGNRDGELDDADIAEIARVISANLAGITREQIDGQRVSAWQRPPGTRRITRAVCLVLVGVVVFALIGVELPLLLNPRVTAAAPHLALTHTDGHLVADIAVPKAGDPVMVQLSSGSQTAWGRLPSTGRQIRWTVPTPWNHASALTVSVCVIDVEQVCISPVANATVTPTPTPTPAP